MNASDILGEILRGGGGGRLKDIFGGRKKAEPRSKAPTPAEIPTGNELERDAQDLEDLLGVGGSGSRTETRRPSPRETNWNRPEPSGYPDPVPKWDVREKREDTRGEREDDESLILLRAMIQAVKADGKLSDDERRALYERVGSQSRDAPAYLQREFDKDCDVRDFTWSVPLGLEYKVYMISLTAIDLDTKAESAYLKELAHGLRLPPEVCAQIHRRCGVRVNG